MDIIKILSLTLFCVCLVCGERRTVFIGKQVICKEYNKNYFYNVTCGIKLINRDKQLYYLNMHLRPVTIKNLRVWHTFSLIGKFIDIQKQFRMKTFYKFRTEYRPSGLYIEEDFCLFLRTKNETKVISLNNFINLSPDLFNCTCPIKVWCLKTRDVSPIFT